MFNTNMIKQFDMTRDTLLKSTHSISEADADVMPQGFNNTIRWHIGHILTATDIMSLFQLVSY